MAGIGKHDYMACLFLIFCLHFIALSTIFQSMSILFVFYGNLTVDDKRQDQKWLSAHSRVLCIYSYLLFVLIKLILGVRSLGSKACGQISTVLGISI